MATDVVHHNQSWQTQAQAPRLTVVVPFFKYDVVPLAQRLLALARPLKEPVAIVFVDDASPDPQWWQAVWQVLAQSDLPCALGVLGRNRGRAKVRNYLAQITASPYLLYLDADMWPDRDDFLARYLQWLSEGEVGVIYGGRSADKVIMQGPDYELHRVMTELREALPATVRREQPAYSFYSCNFLVSRHILSAFPLDEAFTGWGWEDCEWALRVAEQFPIRHEDNPASHLGLLTVDQIIQKYGESIGNFQRILAMRPELIHSTSLYKVSRMLGILHLHGIAGRIAKLAAKAAWLPIRLRLAGLMVYKSSLYAPITRQ